MNSQIDIKQIEEILKLMKQYQADSVKIGNITITKTRHEGVKAIKTPKQILDEVEREDGPTQEDIDHWSTTGSFRNKNA